MSKDQGTFCRLCAEPTPEEQLIEPDSDVWINSRITRKMLWINVDVSPANPLPRSICFSCFDLLERSWNFLNNVRTAQHRINRIYSRRAAQTNSKIKPVNDSAEIAKPVDIDWQDFSDTKTVIKIENDLPQNLEAITVDPRTLLNISVDVDIKNEPDELDTFNGSSIDDTDMFLSSNSDVPLKTVVKKKKKIKKKKRKKPKFTEPPDTEVDAKPLDITLYNMTWDDYNWRCAKCDAQCKSLSALRIHSLEIHECCCVFKCSDCHKVFTNHKLFTNHVKIHNKVLRYCCEVCNLQFAMEQYLKTHKSTHDFDTICQNCGACFDSAESLRDHMLLYSKGYRRKREIKEKVILELKCNDCGKEFKSKSNLLAHRVMHTERSRDFSCHICGKMFFTKGALGTHMLIHDDTKPYQCDYCSIAFRARGNLLSHMSLHTGAKPFVCEQCGKSFRVKRHLKSHSIVHTDLMPYTCQYCNKMFRFKTRLNLHMRQHTGAKPYRCMPCQRDFTNGSNYKKHMKRRHNIDTSKKKMIVEIPIINETEIPYQESVDV